MKRAVVLAVLWACGGKPARPVTNVHADEPEPTKHGISTYIGAPRPALGIEDTMLPDPTEEARWPLTMATHPVLEPHFNIAGALAQPGVGWLDLCGRGIQLRRLPGSPDLGDYLRAWCAVANHDTKGALYLLSQLHQSTVNGLATAVKHDCANIIADHGPADDLQSLLSSAQLHDVELLDLTSASYFEVNRSEDAFAVNKIAIDVDRRPSQEVMCRRLVRGMVVGKDFQREELFARLHNLVVPKDRNLKGFTDSTCEALEHEMHCWLDRPHGCHDYLKEQKRPDTDIVLFDAFEMWPTHEGDADTWMRVAETAEWAAPQDDAYRIVLPALRLAIRTSLCHPLYLSRLDGVVRRLKGLANPNPAFDAPLDALHVEHDRLARLPVSGCQQALDNLPPLE